MISNIKIRDTDNENLNEILFNNLNISKIVKTQYKHLN
jgi:hypothetical protein